MSLDSSKGNDKIFYLHGRPGIVWSGVFNTLLALLFLASAIAQWNVHLQVNVEPWWNQWWFYAICFLIASLLAWEQWHQFFFVRLRIAPDGIWYYRLGNIKCIAWDDIERVGPLNSDSNRKPVFGLILREDSGGSDSRLSISRNRQTSLKFPLSPFVDEWFVSELRSEIKRQRPSLSVQ